ncbi:MAG TPA: HEAT repeat domain-containing protein, partial [Planctomycetota bacterium]|nr:HEAT repeat domain-containing protein [Planctomycetota bacterium]
KREDLAEEIVTALNGFLRHTVVERRIQAAETMAVAFPLLDAAKAEKPLKMIEDRVRSSLNMERDARAYPKVADIAVLVIDGYLGRGDFEGSMRLLEILKKQYQVKEGIFPQRGELAFRALERIASGRGFPIVAEKLHAKDPMAFKVVEALDAAAAQFLVGELKRIESQIERLEVAQLLVKAGAGAGTVLLDEAQKSTIPSEVLRLLEVIPYAMANNMAEVALGGLLRHAVLSVRRRAATLLAERAYERSGTFLLDALYDESDASARVTLLEGLGRLKHARAAGPLEQIADTRAEPDEVRIAACHALGRLAQSSSVPILSRLCARGARGFTKYINPLSPKVRAAAAHALKSYPYSDEARDALKHSLEDPDPSVRAAAHGLSRSLLMKAFGDAVTDAQVIATVQDVEKEKTKFAGSLEEVPLDEACQYLELAHETGLLILYIDGKIARVYFEDGMVVAAEYGEHHDQAVFHELAVQDTGYFLFIPGERTSVVRLRQSVTKLLLEAFPEGDSA